MRECRMHAKCQIIGKACELFYRMPQRNVVSLQAMIARYTKNGFVENTQSYSYMHTCMCIFTTTPWTIPRNTVVVVNGQLLYAMV